jgi:hypothetical protein
MSLGNSTKTGIHCPKASEAQARPALVLFLSALFTGDPSSCDRFSIGDGLISLCASSNTIIYNYLELVVVAWYLAAIGSCLAIGFAYNAAARGINLELLDISLEGNLDHQGFLGISDNVRPGFKKIKIACKVKSDTSRDKLEEFFEHVQEHPLL